MKNIKATPSSYEFLKAAYNRELLQSEQEMNQYRRAKAGAEGEEQFLKILQKYGREHWMVIQNTWFKDFSDFECDFIVVTRCCVYVFEVKNYYGKFVYNNGQCTSRGIPITYNPINQASNATIHLRNLTHKLSNELAVRGTLVFIGDHNQIEIQDTIDYIDILECNDIYEYIQEMIRAENQWQSPSIAIDALIQHYQKYMTEHPYPPTPFKKTTLNNMKRGLYCANCKSYEVSNSGYYVTCACGFYEPKEEAIVRAACEYGVLTYGCNFGVNDIYSYLNGQISLNYIRKVLIEHFEVLSDTKILTFKNLNRDYSKLTHYFKFRLPKKLEFFDWSDVN